MTAHGPIVSDFAGEHRRATDDVNRWRGHCIDCYARIEQAIVEGLDDLITSGRNPSLKRASLFGPRIEMLKKALLDDTFGKHAAAPRDALAALSFVLARRNVLVHGVGKIWIGRGGEWLWQYEFASNVNGRPKECGLITSTEAAQIESVLTSNYRRLGDTLRNLVGSL